MEFIKHFNWVHGELRGRCVLAVDAAEGFQFSDLSGNSPTLEVLMRALALCPAVIEAANTANSRRQHMCAVDVRHGMSGCMDFILVEQRNTALLDYPTVARLHVSMVGKLNQGVAMWVGDLPPVLSAAWAYAPEWRAVQIEEAPTREGLAFFNGSDLRLTVADEFVGVSRNQGADEYGQEYDAPAVLSKLDSIDDGIEISEPEEYLADEIEIVEE